MFNPLKYVPSQSWRDVLKIPHRTPAVRKMCQMIVPIALLLAAQSSDERLSPQVRASSATGLKALGTEFVVCLGLYTDLATETALFLRRFDESWHDPSLTQKEVRNFCQRRGRGLVVDTIDGQPFLG